MERLGISRLCAAKVQPPTQEGYLAALAAFIGWLGLWRVPAWGAPLLDSAMAEFFEVLYDAGGSRVMATRLPCAVMWARPDLPGPARRSFPSSSAALAGWRKLQPPTSRPPLPRAAALAIALELARRGRVGMGLAVLLMFETYGRPSEILQLTSDSVVKGLPYAAGKARCLTLIIRGSWLGVPGKTGEFDLSVPLDLGRQAWIAHCLERWLAAHPQGMLWSFGYEDLAREFHAVAAALNLLPLRPCLYALRHGGASHDRLVEARPLHEVQQRGGWRSHTSVRRYEKHGLVAHQLTLLPELLRQRLLEQEPLCAGRFVRCCDEHLRRGETKSGESSSSSLPVRRTSHPL